MTRRTSQRTPTEQEARELVARVGRVCAGRGATAFVVVPLCLATVAGQRLFARHHDSIARLSRSVSNADRRWVTTAAVNSLLETMKAILVRLAEQLDQALDHVEQLVKTNHVDADRLHPAPIHFRVHVASSIELRSMEALSKFDQLVGILDLLERLGILSGRDGNRTRRRFREEFRDVLRDYRRMAELLREQRDNAARARRRVGYGTSATEPLQLPLLEKADASASHVLATPCVGRAVDPHRDR